MFPIVWLLLTSIKPSELTFAYPPALTFEPTLESYQEVLGQSDFPRYLLNSIIVGTLATTVALALAVPAGYALARMKTRGRGALRAGRPAAADAAGHRGGHPHLHDLPQRRPARQRLLAGLHLPGPHRAHLGLDLSRFIEDLPVELDEASVADGASRWQILRLVARPLAVAAAAAAVLCSQHLGRVPVRLDLTGRDAKTAPVAIVGFMTNKEMYWGRMAAAGTIVLVPVLAFGTLAHRHLVRGLVSGSGK